MKKTLLILLTALVFAACGSDGDEPTPQPEYLDNKLIEGRWYWIQATDSTVYIFENNKYKWELWDKYTKKMRRERFFGKYKLTKDKIIYIDYNSGNPYRLEGDYLWIMESSSGKYTEYTKVKY